MAETATRSKVEPTAADRAHAATVVGRAAQEQADEARTRLTILNVSRPGPDHSEAGLEAMRRREQAIVDFWGDVHRMAIAEHAFQEGKDERERQRAGGNATTA